MEFNYKDTGTAIIIYVHGTLDIQRSTKIDSGLEQLISSDPGRDYIFNLKDMEYSSSAGHGITYTPEELQRLAKIASRYFG